MTEEQRMEEGRRMFQIFAARMFEQRVLTAYREKVARERQDKLLEELDEEAQLRSQREEKKAKEKERKKEKKRLQKLAKEEERLKKESERAEEEAKLRAAEEKRAEEVRKRKEEQKLRREAEKRALDEERRKKEEGRRKRLDEEKEREAERERRRKENLERERKKKEEARKVREEKEAREREAKEREAKERREREERGRKEREAKAKKEAAEREHLRKEEEARTKAEAIAKRPPPPISAPTSIPHQSQHPPSTFNSPHLAVATPALPKQSVGHSPARPRNTSQQGSIQGSVASSPKTPQAVPRIGSSTSPGTPILPHNVPGAIIPPNKVFQFPPHMPHMPPTSPLPHHIAPPPGVTPPEGFPISPIGVNGPMNPFLPGIPQRPPFSNGMPMYSPAQMPLGPSPQYRGFAAPNGMPMQVPATAAMRPIPQQGRGIFMGDVVPGIPHQLTSGVPLIPPGSPFIGNRAEPIQTPGGHSHPPGSFELPIQRPTPIQRPASVAPPKNADDTHNSVDELSKVMGSRALLEDEDEDHLPENQSPRRTSGVGFSPRPSRVLPLTAPMFYDPVGGRSLSVPTPPCYPFCAEETKSTSERVISSTFLVKPGTARNDLQFPPQHLVRRCRCVRRFSQAIGVQY